jgi:hypothetical protein
VDGTAYDRIADAKVGATHLPLARLPAFLQAGLWIERFDELEDREYPYLASACRR